MAQQCRATAEPGLLMVSTISEVRRVRPLIERPTVFGGRRGTLLPKQAKCLRRDGPFQGRAGARRVSLDPTRRSVQSRPARQRRGRGTVGTTHSAHCREGGKNMPRQMQRAGRTWRERQLQLAPLRPN